MAGGLGTRLRSVLGNVPKPLAPVRGRPFLEHLLMYWKKQGIRDFTLSVGYLADQIKNHFRDDYAGCTVKYAVEPQPLGTGGALRLALSGAAHCKSHILVINGDTWYEVSLKDLSDFHSAREATISIALRQVPNSDRYAGVDLDSNGWIRRFGVTSTGSCLINGGCYMVDREKMQNELAGFPSKFSFESDYLPLAAEGRRAAGIIQNKTFLDIGVPTDYYTAPEVIPAS